MAVSGADPQLLTIVVRLEALLPWQLGHLDDVAGIGMAGFGQVVHQGIALEFCWQIAGELLRTKAETIGLHAPGTSQLAGVPGVAPPQALVPQK